MLFLMDPLGGEKACCDCHTTELNDLISSIHLNQTVYNRSLSHLVLKKITKYYLFLVNIIIWIYYDLLLKYILLSVTEGGSSRTDLDIFRVWMKISPACDVSMWDSNFDPVFLGISSMTLRPLRRKFVKQELGRLFTSVGVTL